MTDSNKAAKAIEALRTLVSRLNSCRRHARGVGGMTIDAQIDRSVLLDVRQRWVVDAEEALLEIDYGTDTEPKPREQSTILGTEQAGKP